MSPASAARPPAFGPQADTAGPMVDRPHRAAPDGWLRAAHELKSPTCAMLGLAELMATDTDEPLSPRQAKYLAHLQAAGRHLLTLVDELMQRGLAQAGQRPPRFEPVDLEALAEEALACVASEARGRGLGLQLVAPERRTHALLDRGRAMQVLLNLLSNALKYNRAGGRVVVRIGPGATVSVIDTGRGLGPSEMAALFRPFHRFAASHDGGEDPGGTGLGLAISHELARSMGSALLVSSTPGVGTTVTLQAVEAGAPATTDAGAGAPQAAPSPALAAQRSLLCIDDNPVHALLLQDLLQTHDGLRVRSAETGRDGLALAQVERPLAVLLDLALPDMHGLEVLARLQHEPATRGIPVVVVTGSVNAEELRRARTLGAQDCWTKPLDMAAVASRLAHLIERPAA